MKGVKTMGVNWDYYDRFDKINNIYLPITGEGNNMATQIVTAVNKLGYKWYNDGDVYDNTYYLKGWANDLSSYANWLYKNAGADMLLNITDATSESDYEDILKELADTLLNDEVLDKYEQEPLNGSIYDCDGVFKFEFDDDEEEDS